MPQGCSWQSSWGAARVPRVPTLWVWVGLGQWGQAGYDRAVPGVQGHPGVMGTGRAGTVGTGWL